MKQRKSIGSKINFTMTVAICICLVSIFGIVLQGVRQITIRNRETNMLSLIDDAVAIVDERINGYLAVTRSISEMISDVKYDNIGQSYILNEEGVIIASPDAEKVQNSYSVIEAAKEDKSLSELAKIHEKMVKGESGVQSYKGEQENYIIYRNVEGVPGWSIAIEVSKKDVDKATNTLFTFIYVTALIAILLLSGINHVIGRKLGKK